MPQCADADQSKTELNKGKSTDNCDSNDGVERQLHDNMESKVTCKGLNKCGDGQIDLDHHHLRLQDTLEGVQSLVAEGAGVRTPTSSSLDIDLLDNKDESAAFGLYVFDLQEEINELKEKLRQSETEKQQLSLGLGRYLFFKDREKRSEKLFSVPRAAAFDESKQCEAKGEASEGQLPGGAASFQGQQGMWKLFKCYTLTFEAYHSRAFSTNKFLDLLFCLFVS